MHLEKELLRYAFVMFEWLIDAYSWKCILLFDDWYIFQKLKHRGLSIIKIGLNQ